MKNNSNLYVQKRCRGFTFRFKSAFYCILQYISFSIILFSISYKITKFKNHCNFIAFLLQLPLHIIAFYVIKKVQIRISANLMKSASSAFHCINKILKFLLVIRKCNLLFQFNNVSFEPFVGINKVVNRFAGV
jgi:hypothetical protein